MEVFKKLGKYKWVIGLIKEVDKEDRNNVIAGYKERKKFYTSPYPNFEADLKGMVKCSTCPNMCRFDCPALLMSKKEPYSPANKARIGLFMGMQRIPIEEPSAINAMYACMNCDACREWCPMDISTGDLLQGMRAELEKRELIPNCLQHLKENINATHSIFEETPFSEDSEFNINMEKPEIFYYIGCMSAKYQKDMVRANIALLKKIGINFCTHFESRECCGSPLNKVGYKSVAQGLANHNQKLIHDSKAKIIITDCPACEQMLSTTYEDFDIKLKPKIMHTMNYFLEQMNAGKLKPTKTINKIITFHDPCILARKNKNTTQVREFISKLPGISLKEAYLHGNETRCCGYGGGYQVTNPEFSNKLGQERIEQLRKYDADYLVSACPTCEYAINQAKIKTPEKKDKIKDLTELLADVMDLKY